MPTLKRFRDIRELELFLFSGVPEVPQSQHDLEGHEHAPRRQTGRCTKLRQPSKVDDEEIVIGSVKIDYKKNSIIVEEFGDKREFH